MAAWVIVRRPAVVAGLLITLLVLGGCFRSDSGKSPGTQATRPLRVAYIGSPMAAPLFVAAASRGGADRQPLDLLQFKTSGDAGYALLWGEVDAALIEPLKTPNLLQTSKFPPLKVAGTIQFPYGATLVLRKDLSLRFGELAGRTVAAEGEDCGLWHQFKTDARRLGLDPERIRTVYMPFEDMVPSLEAKTVDAILTKGSYGVIGESLGHKILYQNWDVAAGTDECCPAILAQTVYFLVVRRLDDETVARLVQTLEATGQEKLDEVRGIVSKQTGISEKRLAHFPVATFSAVTDELGSLLKDHAWSPRQ